MPSSRPEAKVAVTSSEETAILALRGPIFQSRMRRDYVGPSRDELVPLLATLDLRRPFWQI
jgi:hypothetical protein